MDFQSAGIKHLLWKKNIRSMIDGKEKVEDIEQISHKDCELTKWIDSQQQSLNYQNSQLVELDTLHIEVHMISNRIIHLFSRGQIQEAVNEYEGLDILSKKFITKLTAMSLNAREDK
jgi:hypothetical protein